MMLNRTWQRAMIGLARSGAVKNLMQGSRAGTSLAKRYVAGATASDGLERAVDLLRLSGTRSSLFYLGEYVETPDLVDENVANKLAIAEQLGAAGIDVHVSVDPTQIGLRLGVEMARKNARLIAEAVARASSQVSGVHCLMFDMEDQGVTDTTISLHDELRRDGLPVALTLQAYLRRTASDVQRQIAAGSRVRLVRGAFAATAEVAFTGRAEIKRSYRDLITAMLSAEARKTGFYPIFATHDTALHEFAIRHARLTGWRAGEYEFEMLFGVRPDVAEALAKSGERVRLYVPFGHDWWPHAVRRIGENPANATLLLRSLVR